MKIVYLGIKNNRFTYEIELNGHKFDYFTGLGHSKQSRTKPSAPGYVRLTESESKEVIKSIKYIKTSIYDAIVWRKHPEEEDVYEALYHDVMAGSMSFNDFCREFGYSSDSISALDIYRACMKTAEKLEGFDFKPYLRAEELL